jgi:hypothetical protein
MPEGKVGDQDAPVKPAALSEQQHGTTKVLEQPLEEGHHLRGSGCSSPDDEKPFANGGTG